MNLKLNLIFQQFKRLAKEVHMVREPHGLQGRHGWQGPQARALPRFWVSIHSYKKQPVKKNWGRILGLAWLKFAVVFLNDVSFESLMVIILEVFNNSCTKTGSDSLLCVLICNTEYDF